MFKDLFISYGRRESLGFVARLHQKLKLTAYEAWFDKVNIPDGEVECHALDTLRRGASRRRSQMTFGNEKILLGM